MIRTPNSDRLPSLDGWRAMSIALVLGSHCTQTYGFPGEWKETFQWLFNGEFGVRCFFTISGFLITYLMLAEAKLTGRVDLCRFYLRRSLRILPVYFLFLLTLSGLQLSTPFSLTRLQWISSVTFTVNFVQNVWTNGHLWSLAVEEQFYLFWPLAFSLAGLFVHLRRAALLLLFPLVLAPVFRVIGYTGWVGPELRWLFNRYSFLLHFDALAIGCLVAFLLVGQRTFVERVVAARPGMIGWAALGLIGVPHALSHFFMAGMFTVPLGPTAQGLGFALLLLQSIVLPTVGFYRFLNWKAVCQLGVLSYSIYIWQQIFCSPWQVLQVSPVWWLSFPGWLVPTFCAAVISYYSIELPLVKWRARFR